MCYCNFRVESRDYIFVQLFSFLTCAFYNLLQLPLAKDVDLDAIAYMTEGFSGADIQALLSDAQLAAVHELLSSADGNEPGKMPVITDALLRAIASKARPSISEAEKRRLYNIYSQFLDSKRSVAAQVSPSPVNGFMHFNVLSFLD